MTNTNATLPPANFAPTNVEVLVPSGRREFRTVHIPSVDALAWDAPAAETNCVIESAFYRGVFCYARLEITGRKWRVHRGGIGGYAARILFTGADETTGQWRDAVVRW